MRSVLLTVIQLILCAAVIISAFAIKLYGGELYDTVREWYYGELNSSVLISAYAPTVATPDEA